jgi:6,7-dimethyl-8-ribityllumazine synthase
MSTAHPIRPRSLGKATLSFAIVAGQYNLTYTQGLVDHAQRELNDLEPGGSIKLVWAPGAYEIPLMVKMIAAQKKVHAILALGVVLQGETAHAGLITQAVTSALLDISLEYTVPVINEVLLLQDEQQAEARCLGTEINRGVEAARAAIAAARTVRELTPKTL